tara:strand:+ start:26 stop:256 length:231 start_codon:yes stop_codon:yes gene_type:complete
MPSSSDDKKATERFDKATVRKAEKFIDASPEMRKARDIANGYRPGSGITTGVNDQAYKDGWDRIFGKKHPDKQDGK